MTRRPKFLILDKGGVKSAAIYQPQSQAIKALEFAKKGKDQKHKKKKEEKGRWKKGRLVNRKKERNVKNE